MNTLSKIACWVSLASVIAMPINAFANNIPLNTPLDQQNKQLAFFYHGYHSHYGHWGDYDDYYYGGYNHWNGGNMQMGIKPVHWDNNGNQTNYNNTYVACPMVQVCDFTGSCYWENQPCWQ